MRLALAQSNDKCTRDSKNTHFFFAESLNWWCSELSTSGNSEAQLRGHPPRPQNSPYLRDHDAAAAEVTGEVTERYLKFRPLTFVSRVLDALGQPHRRITRCRESLTMTAHEDHWRFPWPPCPKTSSGSGRRRGSTSAASHTKSPWLPVSYVFEPGAARHASEI